MSSLCVFLFIQLYEILPCCYQLVIDCSCSLLYNIVWLSYSFKIFSSIVDIEIVYSLSYLSVAVNILVNVGENISPPFFFYI